MTTVKICGITNLEDALMSVRLGANALGFNFYPGSSRYILPGAARNIIAKLPATVLKVGVFVNESVEHIVEIAAEAGELNALQLHGDEPPEFLSDLRGFSALRIIKAFRVDTDFEPETVLKYNADFILLDTFSSAEYGGTGETFDWETARRVQAIFPRMFLAGGLSAENIGEAIGTVRPFGVDACSGLELEKGKKDPVKLAAFFKRILPLS